MYDMKIAVLAALTVALAFAGGCMQAQYTELGAQSHFDYPNSNVTPLGPVKVEVDGHSSFLTMVLPTSDDHLKAYNAALTEVEGANIIIDYVKTVKIYGFGPLVSWSKVELEGTAAKMEVGEVELR